MSDNTELYVEAPAKLEDSPHEGAPPELDPQAEIRAQIAERYEQRRLAEIQEGHERMGLPAEEEPEREAENDRYGPARDAPQQPAPQQQQAGPQAPQLYPVQTPDGRWHQVTAEQAAQLVQIGAAAVVQQQPAYQQPPQRSPYQQSYQEPAARRAALDPERARAIAQQLSFGTTDEQAQALQDYAQLIQPRHGPQEVSQAAARQVRAEMQLEQNLGVIGREYPEIFNDAVLTQVAAVQLHQLRGNPQNSYRPDLDLYREACNAVRSRFQSAPRAGQAAAAWNGNGGGNGRLERKRSAPTMPSATDRRLAMEDEGPREQTASEVIAQMRRARGQSV